MGHHMRVRMKQGVKRGLQAALPTRLPPLVVASMGRSGSTLIWKGLCQAAAAHRFGGHARSTAHRLVADQAWDLGAKSLQPGVVYKTHDLARAMPDGSPARVVFLFGPASDAALSVLSCQDRYGPDWVAEHFRHLRASGTLEDLPSRDVLNFEEQIDGWIGKRGTARMILHYDALWDHQDQIAAFTGLPMTLPPRRDRVGAASVAPDLQARVRASYAALDAKIAALPVCQVLE